MGHGRFLGKLDVRKRTVEGAGKLAGAEFRLARVIRRLDAWRGATVLEVELEGCPGRSRALNYDAITGQVDAGDRVLLNTTAVSLGLGTGGLHFVLAVQGRERRERAAAGHIMKLRYTPLQLQCLTIEEEAHPARAALTAACGLEGMVVVVGCVHSQLAPIVAGMRAGPRPRPRVAYVMTDGGALPLAFSRTVAELCERGWLAATITAGHAFGGDYEAVNLYTALLCARAVVGAELAVVVMGPGVVGTGTAYGFTAVEQGEIVDRVNVLGGNPVAALRVSFGDSRPRHRGVSHHCLTALGRVALTRAVIAVPTLEAEQSSRVWAQLEEAQVTARHRLIEAPGEPALDLLVREGLEVTTMGRGLREDPAFFQAAGAAGLVAAQLSADKEGGMDHGSARVPGNALHGAGGRGDVAVREENGARGG